MTCKNCLHKCAYDWAQLQSITKHITILIILALILQTVTANTLPTGGEGFKIAMCDTNNVNVKAGRNIITKNTCHRWARTETANDNCHFDCSHSNSTCKDELWETAFIDGRLWRRRESAILFSRLRSSATFNSQRTNLQQLYFMVVWSIEIVQ